MVCEFTCAGDLSQSNHLSAQLWPRAHWLHFVSASQFPEVLLFAFSSLREQLVSDHSRFYSSATKRKCSISISPPRLHPFIPSSSLKYWSESLDKHTLHNSKTKLAPCRTKIVEIKIQRLMNPPDPSRTHATGPELSCWKANVPQSGLGSMLSSCMVAATNSSARVPLMKTAASDTQAWPIVDI